MARTLVTSSIFSPVTATGTTVGRTLEDRFADIVNVKDFGAVGDGVADDTAAIQAAINIGKPVYLPTGIYKVTNALTLTTKSQRIFGDGRRQRTKILIPNTFNLSAQGVFVCQMGEEGPFFENFEIDFIQPNTDVRANLINYPPAIVARATPRFTVNNVTINEAMTGIDMTGNSGGVFIDQLQLSCYSYGILIDGALDTVRINDLHFWPFDLVYPNNFKIFNDGQVTGMSVGTCDDLKLTDSIFINKGKQLHCFKGIEGRGPFGNISNVAFDTFATLLFEDGNMMVDSCNFSLGTPGWDPNNSVAELQALKQTGGYLTVTNCMFENANTLSGAYVQLSASTFSTNTPITLQMNNCLFRMAGNTQILHAAGLSNKQVFLTFTNNILIPPLNFPTTKPLIAVGFNTRITAIGNRLRDVGSPTSNIWLSAANDDWHTIIGNSPLGWKLITQPINFATIFGNGNQYENDYISRPVLTNIPTSSTGLPAGAVWRDAAAGNVLKIVP